MVATASQSFQHFPILSSQEQEASAGAELLSGISFEDACSEGVAICMPCSLARTTGSHGGGQNNSWGLESDESGEWGPRSGELELDAFQAGEALDNARSDLHGAVYPATHPSQMERWLDAQSSERNFVHLAIFFSCLDVWQDGWEKDR